MELLNETTAVVLQTSKNQTTPYYFVDAYTSYMVETVINVGVISAITVIGVGTNVVNMFIFFKQVTKVFLLIKWILYDLLIS